MGIFDELLQRGEDEPETDLKGGGFTELPVNKWLLLRPIGEDNKGHSTVEMGDERRAWPVLRLGLEVVGAEEEVPKQNHGGTFHRLTLDTKEEPGEPSGRLRAIANTFLSAGLEHNSRERKINTIDTLAKMAAVAGMKEEDYDSPAEFFAAVLAETLTVKKPLILARTYLRKGKKYKDPTTNEDRIGKDRVELTDWTDATEENIEKQGVVRWEVAI